MKSLARILLIGLLWIKIKKFVTSAMSLSFKITYKMWNSVLANSYMNTYLTSSVEWVIGGKFCGHLHHNVSRDISFNSKQERTRKKQISWTVNVWKKNKNALGSSINLRRWRRFFMGLTKRLEVVCKQGKIIERVGKVVLLDKENKLARFHANQLKSRDTLHNNVYDFIGYTRY